MPALTVLCTCGLAAEARIARRAGFSVMVGAGNRERTKALLAEAVGKAHCLVSFGIAGALAPQLRTGDLILSGEVIASDGRWKSEEGLVRRLGDLADLSDLARRLGAVEGPVFGAASILAIGREKERRWKETGAIAVDLESDVVARAAHEAQIPFLVLRAIADPASRDLPPAALIPLAADGTPAVLRVLAEVVRRPRQIAALCALALETRRALSALVQPARALHTLVGGV